MRSHFADWAAHNSAKMDYLSPEQYESLEPPSLKGTRLDMQGL